MRRFGGLATGLFTALAGCGDDGVHHLADAPPHVDGALPADAAIPATTVTTYTHDEFAAPGTVIASVPVVVVNPDGTAGESGTTGADGTVTFTHVIAGSAITAIYPENPDRYTEVVTIAGVSPGAHLKLGQSYFNFGTTGGAAATITAHWPVIAGARYTIESATDCGGSVDADIGQTSASLVLAASCQTPTLPLLFSAYDEGGGLVGHGFLPTAAGTDGAAPTLAAWSVPTANNVALSVSGVGADMPASINGDYVNAVYAGDQYGNAAVYQNPVLALAGTTANAHATLPLDGVRQVAYAEQIATDDSYGPRVQYHAFANDSTTDAIPAMTLPWVGVVDHDDTSFSWTQTAGTADAVHIYAEWTTSTTDGESTVFHYHDWYITAPFAGQTTYTWAGVPAALADVVPPPAEQIYKQMSLVDIGGVTSYAQLLALPEWVLTDIEAATWAGDVPSIDVADGAEGNLKAARPIKRRHHGRHAKRAR